MSNPHSHTFVLFVIIIPLIHLTCLNGISIGTISALPDISNKLRNDSASIKTASSDYGNLVHEKPRAVLYPTRTQDIIELVKSTYQNEKAPLTISARGHGHSAHGQAMARDGIVIDMSSLNKSSGSSSGSRRITIGGNQELGFYADVGGDQLWIDVLRETHKRGLLPVSWTDYLYLSVGGTLSNAGISGQTFLHGPHISNVLELDVVTGRGELVTCSEHKQPDLFFAVLGGLGQFGIITRARIVLRKAPARAKWVRLLYSDFSIFSRDQEHLISRNASDYVEGFIIINETTINDWRSSFSSNSSQSEIAALLKKNGLLYAIELVKYYQADQATIINQEFQKLLNELNYTRELIFSTDTTIVEFLSRVGNLDIPNQTIAHPWLNLFVPKSRIHDFNERVLVNMIPRFFNGTSGTVLFYPMNRNKWDDRTSAVIPDEDIFYTLSLLHASSGPKEIKVSQELNDNVLKYCDKAGIKAKQYCGYQKSKADWINHFGSKWDIIQKRKAMFDPKHILSPGQRLFN